MLKRISIMITAGLIALSAASATNEETANIAARADRFFSYREWISAGALYTMLLGDDPANTTYCSRAIVAAGMLGDSLQQASLTDHALNAHIPVDSLFSAVERTSFSVGQTSLYEHYLLQTKARSPWLKRIIDTYLMRYYTYRRDPDGMITYSHIMLQGNPENELFLYTLAQGYLLDGQIEQALDTYRHIASLNPRSLEALLYLANHYYSLSAADSTAAAQALAYFLQAETIKSTPYITDAIRKLRNIRIKTN